MIMFMIAIVIIVISNGVILQFIHRIIIVVVMIMIELNVS